MNRSVYTYINLKELGSSPYWKEIRKYPQITATAELRKSLKGTEESDRTEGIFRNDAAVCAWEFRKIADTILPHWTDDTTKFHETIVLAQFIRKQIIHSGDSPEIKNWLIGCRRNLNMILSSIVLLEEADISPTDIRSLGDRNIEILLNAWRYLTEHDPAIKAFHARMKELENRKSWDLIFNKVFGRTDIHTLVFHGFYYFTPFQERIMRLMEGAGIRLIFLFPYDEKYPYANEIWRKTYSVENGYPDIAKWHIEKNDKKEAYGEIFEGRRAEVPNKLRIKEYASVIEFVHEMKHAKEQGYFIYSSNSNAANDILRDFYPEEYGERKLLSYPIGQFVSTLNRMWDEDLQEIILDENRVIECFASGWLAADGVSGKQYMQDLVRIMPFFADCRSIAEWENRISLLRDIQENAVDSFIKDLDVDEHAARWQSVMGNPLLNFGVFSVEKEKLEVILNLIQRLLSMAKELFGKEQTIKVSEHIRKLDSILLQHEMSNELYEEEKELVRDLFEKLGDPSGFTAECFPADISSALNLYMSTAFKREKFNRIESEWFLQSIRWTQPS